MGYKPATPIVLLGLFVLMHTSFILQMRKLACGCIRTNYADEKNANLLS